MNIVLKLKQDGGQKRVEKKFQASFLPAILFKKTIQLANQFEGISGDDVTEEISDIMVQYIVEVFDNQFTLEDFYNGADAGDILPKFQECMENVMNKFGQKSKELAGLNK